MYIRKPSASSAQLLILNRKTTKLHSVVNVVRVENVGTWKLRKEMIMWEYTSAHCHFLYSF